MAEGDAARSRGSLVRRSLLAADMLGLVLAWLATGGLTGHRGHYLALLLVLPAWACGAKLFGLYDRDDQHPDHTTVDDLVPVFELVTIGTWLGVVAVSAVGNEIAIGTAVTFWVAAFFTISAARAAARVAVRHHPAYPQNTIIVGAGEVGQLVGRKLLQHPEFGTRVVGFVDSDPKAMRGDLQHVPVLGPPNEIIDIVTRYGISRVIVAFSNDRHDLLVELVRSLRDFDVQIDVVPRLFEAVGPAVAMHVVEGVPLVGLPPARPSQLARVAKRAIDVILAASILVLTAPLFALIAVLIKRDSPGPVFFRQERLGEDQRRFTLLKFRTMTVGTDEGLHREYMRQIMDPSATPNGNNLYKLERTEDVTRVGAWLRRTSLDELPQLINVLRGEMSIVGPRPCLGYETELFEPHHLDRFLVPAGMTGLWQVSARAHSTFKEALDLDVAYARNWSLKLDFWLLARTPLVLMRSRETT